MYLRVLEAVMADDTLKVSQLPLALASSQQSIAADNPALPVQVSRSLAEWLDSKIEELGDASAILIGDERLSWNSLKQRSWAMAAGLQSLGIKPGQIVALRLESGLNDAAAALALLRIGAISLPLPATSTPLEWTALLASQQPALALASATFAAKVVGFTAYEQLLTDGPEKSEQALSYPQSSDIAWLGVNEAEDGKLSAIPSSHHATLQNLLAAAEALDLRSGDTVLITPAESATDAWVDLLLPLVAGATLFYPDNQKPASLQSLLDQQQVSFAFAAPSGVLTALNDRWAGDRRLNIVVRGGLLSNTLAARLCSTPYRLWSLLSSPQTAGPMAVGKVVHPTEYSIGFTALASQQLVILDENGQQVPVGVSGELTAVTDSGKIGINYLARLSPDLAGKVTLEIIDFVNRRVRLHGYRLRLGELEDLLWKHPAVADTVAALIPVDGVNTLVAYFRTFDSVPDAVRLVRDHFQNAAPGHLAGAELISVDSIPRNAAGSADFALLPAPGSAKLANIATDEYVAPRDELESNLVAIWEEVLGIRPIGIRTPFFKLGGYSLMIVRLFARINKTLGTALPITTIFNAPTVEQLADLVRGRAYYSSLVPVHTGGTRPPFFMIHSYLLYQGIPRVMGDDYPFYGLRELETDAEDMTVEQRAAAYLDAIRSIQPTGPYYIGGWCAAGPLAVETARQIAASGEKVGFLVLFDSWRPGYAAELAKEQAGTKEMSLSARLGRKFRFHRNRWRGLSTAGRFRYVAATFTNKFASVKNRFYLKNWAIAEMLCKRFGLSLPHFMHNVSLTTLNSLKEYKGVEPYSGSLTLIRAEQAPYFPGAKESCGWDAIVKGGVNVMWAPGDHESMFLDPHLQKVGELLRKSLAEAYVRQA
jgi:thioesterase domain-containing protein/acyl-coenzyme A synthetase/AMP-(fatty) acid ligase/acyl carrier protein